MSHKNADQPPVSIETIEEDMAFFDDWEDRYRYLIDLGKALPTMEQSLKTPANIVHGCTSQVWLCAEHDKVSNKLQLKMDSDALIVRGLLGLVAAAYAGKSPDDAATFDINSLFERLDLLSHLSMTRGNGLRAMVGRIQALAKEMGI